MSQSNYQYYADDGTLYQVTLPDDFATALGQTPAIGTEPYLDTTIHPRIANYRTTNALFRQAVITTTTAFNTLAPTLVVSGLLYNMVGTIAEQRSAYFNPALYAASGPPGQPGPAGFTPVFSASAPTGDITLPASGDALACSISLPAGKFLITANLTVKVLTTSQQVIAALYNGASFFAAAEMCPNAINPADSLTVTALLTLSAPAVVALYGLLNGSTNGTIKQLDDVGGTYPVTQLWAMQVG
jgi:hypothetical protein